MEILKYLELNDNENITYQNLWDAIQLALRRTGTTSKYVFRKTEN